MSPMVALSSLRPERTWTNYDTVATKGCPSLLELGEEAQQLGPDVRLRAGVRIWGSAFGHGEPAGEVGVRKPDFMAGVGCGVRLSGSRSVGQARIWR